MENPINYRQSTNYVKDPGVNSFAQDCVWVNSDLIANIEDYVGILIIIVEVK